MAVHALVSVDEYLHSSYSPGKAYVDGFFVGTNAGEWQHALVQSNLIFALRAKYPNIKIVPEPRSRTKETRFRLPDVAVVLRPPEQGYPSEPPFVAIEILAEADRVSRLLEKLREYAEWGVPHIWMLDPAEKRMYTFLQGALTPMEGDLIRAESPRLELTRAEIFQD